MGYENIGRSTMGFWHESIERSLGRFCQRVDDLSDEAMRGQKRIRDAIAESHQGGTRHFAPAIDILL
jgi:hypothetical protein